MKLKNLMFVAFCLFTLSVAVSSCSKEEEPVKQEVFNNMIGTWKWESTTNTYWYQLEFNEDLTGRRTDADGEDTAFTYTFTDSEVNFTTGFPNGKYEYSIIENNKLNLFGNVLLKQ
ncbi:hypothetical protein [Cesiribacter sp. SM1]|uniref:hypothetical protein n=1 Tax=Cesiribacter sp. SM1 TaxID=2861196 RepID=UPI001CD48144|nr:hypothetical protein [Cesiribacter sp. SM1]